MLHKTFVGLYTGLKEAKVKTTFYLMKQERSQQSLTKNIISFGMAARYTCSQATEFRVPEVRVGEPGSAQVREGSLIQEITSPHMENGETAIPGLSQGYSRSGECTGHGQWHTPAIPGLWPRQKDHQLEPSLGNLETERN